MKSSEEVKLAIPSDLKYLGAVDALVQDLAREFCFPEKCINDISTAIIEGCTNAIEHGNKFSKTKKVVVTVKFEGKTIVTRICDEGEGFDYEARLRNENPPDPLSEKGRGILIMKAFTDEMKFSYVPDKGLCLELVRCRDSEDGGEA
jgi:serine/threonine-protein kinase RsbW